MSIYDVIVLLSAGLGAGILNSIAGGGSLITYPTLISVGIPPIWANTNNGIAVAPAYFAAAFGSRNNLKGQRRRLLGLIPTAAIGSTVGPIILLNTSHAVFENIVPLLIFCTALLMGFGPKIQKFVQTTANKPGKRHSIGLHIIVGLCCVYGSYFNAGLGLILIAALAATLPDNIQRIGALKNGITAVVGVVTVIIYSLFTPVEWWAVAAVAPTALIGGYLGSHYLQRIPERPLRLGIVVYGLVLSVVMLLS